MAFRTRRAVERAPTRPDEIPTLRGKPVPTFDSRAGDVEFFDAKIYEQGGEAWHQLRLGMPTASVFGAVMAKGKDGGESLDRRALLYRLAGEVLSGEKMEDYANKYMQRGKDMEPEAREQYAFGRRVELRQVGFVRRSRPRGKFVGCSPDSLVGEKRGLEVKTMAPHLMIELIHSGRVPVEHRAQIQGTCWVAGLDVVDLMIFYRGMPVTPTFEFVRDEAYIALLAEQVEIFQWELDKIVERVRDSGGKR